MNMPPPVDLNKLKSILGASKAIMNKVESGNFETGHVDARALNEDGVKEMHSEGYRPQSQYQSNTNFDRETIMNSRLPEAIKKAMIDKPIPQITNPNYTFSLNDVADLVVEKPMGYPKTPKTQQIQESYGKSDMITVSKTELTQMVNAIVNERLLEFYSKNHNKAITENAVTKTISLLIKEGKLPQRKKTI
jgi:hypothetical protein